eukprot:767700-Hanusia_phi.AAC.5
MFCAFICKAYLADTISIRIRMCRGMREHMQKDVTKESSDSKADQHLRNCEEGAARREGIL